MQQDKALHIAEEALTLCQLDYAISEPILQISLPYLRLSIQSTDLNYIALCQKALIDGQHYHNAEDKLLHLVVTDQQSRPHVPVPTFNTAKFGLGALFNTLEIAGMQGCHDTELDSWQFYEPHSGRGIQLLTMPGAIPAWEQAFPLRNFLHWAYAVQGRRLVHAGTLGLNTKGVMLAGAGGAGKSGTTLAGIVNGLQSVGDDYVALDIDDNSVTAFPVISLMKQDPNGLSRLGLSLQDGQWGATNWQGKHEFDFNKLIPESRAHNMSMNAILLPKITGQSRSKITAATAHEAMFALLPNNLQQLPGQMRQAMSFFSHLTRQLPAFHLELGTEPVEITDTILNFIEKDI